MKVSEIQSTDYEIRSIYIEEATYMVIRDFHYAQLEELEYTNEYLMCEVKQFLSLETRLHL
jgi:hypothetical protein